MADNVTITSGSGTTIATDDIGGVHYQVMKVAHGADGSATHVSTSSPMPVRNNTISTTPTVTSLTLADTVSLLPSSAKSGRTLLEIQNVSPAGNLWIGDASVKEGYGQKVGSGETLRYNIAGSGVVYGMGQAWELQQIIGDGYQAVLCVVDGTYENAVVVAGTAKRQYRYSADDFAQIWRSTDGGATWALAQEIKGIQAVHSMTKLSGSGSSVYLLAGTYGDGHVYRSGNSGLTWVDQGQLGSATTVTTLCHISDSGDSAYAVAGTDEGIVYRSTDGGQNWSTIGQLGTSTVVYKVIHVYGTGNGAVLLAGTNEDIFRSLDGGQNWSAVSSGMTTIRALACYDRNTTYGIGASYDGDVAYVFASSGNDLYKSTDAGQTWTLNEEFSVYNIIDILVVSERYRGTVSGEMGGNTPNTYILLATNGYELSETGAPPYGEIYYSADGGTNWYKSQRMRDGFGTVSSMVHLGGIASNAWVLAGTGTNEAGVYRTKTAGRVKVTTLEV